MLFHTTEFLLFLVAFTLAYALVRERLRWRNLLVVAASHVFYGWWDWRFLGLLLFSSWLDYRAGIGMARARHEAGRRRWLVVSVAGNLGVLCFFKYFGFFMESFHALLGRLGVSEPSWTWNIILPVGISFYTFQTLSYSIDVYRRRIEPTHDWTAFFAYVAFFPQLVAGPIERGSHLLPQFLTTRRIRAEDLEEGAWLVTWGFFKKVVVADQLAPFADLAFGDGPRVAAVVLLGVLAFAGQIYGDFSGYSDIARGLARWFGFDLMQNFNLPYTAGSVREFWQRWHISLSTWLRDYLYIPMGGSRSGEWRTRRNLMITMVLGGLWHGAAWTFVLWGAWHGIALAVHRAWSSRARLPRWAGWILTMLVVGYGWMLFRAESLADLAALHAALLDWSAPGWIGGFALGVAARWMPLILVQAWQLRKGDLLAPMRAHWAVRAPLMGLFLVAIAAYWQQDRTPFIYFQF